MTRSTLGQLGTSLLARASRGVIGRRGLHLGLAIITLAAIVGPNVMIDAPQAHLHKEVNGELSYFFSGMTFEENNLEEDVDPINAIIYGGGGPVTVGGVGDMLFADAGLRGACGSRQRVKFKRFGPSGHTASMLETMQVSEDTLECNGIVALGRMHVRLWNDHVHRQITDGHGPANQWMLAGVHRDATVTHKPGMDWDDARRWFVEKMDGHCSWRKWRLHPGARGLEQGLYNSGWIARVSRRGVPNCAGA